MSSSSQPEDPLVRLSRAVDAFLQLRDRDERTRAEYLEGHADLCDLLEPMLAERAGDESDEEPGERFLGDFHLLREIGRGGMGVVYEAEQVSLGRRVAVKVLPAHLTLSAVQIERFRREATAAARLRHPGIVPIHFVGEAAGAHFFAMEYVDGFSLHDRLERIRDGAATSFGVLDDRSRAAEATEVVAQAAEALHYAHQNGVIHRDVKPHNILIGADRVVRLVDFGLAKDLDRQTLSHTGEFAGTPQYVSPEQALGRRDRVDHRSDVFSLGVVLYEMLAGSGPFGGETTEHALSMVVSVEPRRLRKCAVDVPADLEIVCHKALEKHPADRYQSAGEMADDLRRFLRHEPIHATRPSALARALKYARRRRARTAAVAASVALLAAASGLWWHGAREAAHARRTLAQARAILLQTTEAVDMLRAHGLPGSHDLYRDQVESLVSLYEELLSSSDEPPLRTEATRAYLRASELYDLLELDAESRAMSTRAIVLARALVEESPLDPVPRYQLAKALFNRSRAWPATAGGRADDLAKATELFRELEPLPGPGDVPVRSRALLAMAYTGRVVDIEGWASGRVPPAGAQELLERALALWSRVPEPMRERELRTRCELAYVYMARREWQTAVQVLTETVELGEAWLVERPGHPDVLRLLAMAYGRLSQSLEGAGDREGAITASRRTIERQSEYAARHPRPWARGDLAFARLKLAKLLLHSGREAEADVLLQQAEAALVELMQAHPGHPGFAGVLAELRSTVASRLLKRGGGREELELLHSDAVELYRRALAADPGNVALWRRLGGTLGNLANRELAWGETEAAYGDALEAVAAQERALEGNPANRTSRAWLARHYRVLLRAAERLGKHVELAAAAEAYASHRPDDGHAQMHAAIYLSRCVTRVAAGDEALARSYGDRAVAVLRGMVEKGMAEPASIASSHELAPLRRLESFRALVEEPRR